MGSASGEYDIVDAHTHIHRTAADAAAFRGSLDPRRNTAVGDLADARSYMARHGVRKMVLLPLIAARREYDARIEQLRARGDDASPEAVRAEIGEAWSAYNLWVAEVAAAEPETFTAAVAVDPLLLGEEWARAQIERSLAAGARAIKIMPAFIGCAPGHEAMRVVWELAERHGLPVVSQSGLTPYTEVGHPDNFESVARAHPRAKVILAHMGMGAEDRTIALTAACPNVFVDTSAWFDVRPDPDSWLNRQQGTAPSTPEDVAALLRAIGVDRVLFGTNFAIRPAEPPRRWIRALALTERERRQIFSENYARVYEG